MNLFESLDKRIRHLQGKQPEPSDVVGNFAMFPNPDEQMRIRVYTGNKLGHLLRDNPDIAAQTMYDIIFALNDRGKARSLLWQLENRNPRDIIETSLYSIYQLRKKDNAPTDELAIFAGFCNEAGYDFSSPDGEKNASRLLQKRTLSQAVYDHVSAS